MALLAFFEKNREKNRFLFEKGGKICYLLSSKLVSTLDLFERKILTVSQLTGEIKDLLESQYDDVWVEGEISNLRRSSAGHVYFTLKDENSQIRTVMFKMQVRYLRFHPEDGIQVICWGRVGIYEKRGEYQLVLDYVEPKGIGSLQLAFEQLKERLAEEGFFDEARKRSLPLLPKRIGIVTSPTGAAIRDMLNILRRRFENIEVVIYPVKVQGEGAAEEIAQGIEYLAERETVDVIIVGRGGGSLEDLWAFNEEVVGRAIFHSPVPIVSAVGHETDFTIADFVADFRAPTPSAAAEVVVREKRDLIRLLGDFQERMERQIIHFLRRKGDELKRTRGRLRDPRRRTEELRLRLDDYQGRLTTAVSRTCREKRERTVRVARALLARAPLQTIAALRDDLQHWRRRMIASVTAFLSAKRKEWEREAARLDAMSPLNVLRRGYSITRRVVDRIIVRDTDQVEMRDMVEVNLYRGRIICRVEAKE